MYSGDEAGNVFIISLRHCLSRHLARVRGTSVLSCTDSVIHWLLRM